MSGAFDGASGTFEDGSTRHRVTDCEVSARRTRALRARAEAG